MTLQVEIPSGDTESRFLASEVVLERALGQPVIWRLRVQVLHNDYRLPYLAALLEGGQVKVKVLHKEASLGLEGIIVGVHASEANEDQLVIEAHATSLAAAPSPAPDPDPFTPRWRVHTGAQNLLKVAQKFAHIATLPTWVKNELEKVKFTPDDFTSVIQDGLSDWGFLSHLMDQYGMLGAEAALKPLVLMGSVEEAPGKWLVTYGSKAAYDKLGDITNREIEFPETTLERFVFPAARPDNLADALLPVPLAMRLRKSRVFVAADWTAWVGKDLPLFTKTEKRMIYKVVDRLWNADTIGEVVEWSTQMSPLPEGAVVAGPEPPVPISSWFRLGKVTEVKPLGPWLKAELEGFESGSNTVQARLQTSYAGLNGQRGLHLVPEKDTKVLLTWSSRFHEPLLVLGNIREKETTFEHPSLWLEALTTQQYTDILVKEVGKTTVESDYDVLVKKTTTMTSTGALKVTGDDTTDVTSAKAFNLIGKDATSLESTGALKLTGKNTTDIASTGAFKIDGKATTDIASTGPFKLDAKATTDIASTGPLTLDGKATTMVKGVGGVHLNP